MAETIVSATQGIVRCGHKKAAIIGAGPNREQAPWGDTSYCWWALNEIYQPYYDRHFELHPMRVQSQRDLDFLATCPTPCYVLDLEDAESANDACNPGRPRRGVKNAVEFPRKRLKAAGYRDYFTCTFGFQIALACLEGFEEIGLWGVELFLGTARERVVERACVEYWLGFAEGRGIKVVADSSLAAHRSRWLYGYDYDEEKKAVENVIAELGEVIEAGEPGHRTRTCSNKGCEKSYILRPGLCPECVIAAWES